MAIIETISVDAAGAIGGLNAFAAAAEETAGKVQASFAKMGKIPAVGGAGAADGLAASLDAAAAKINASVAQIEASMGRLSEAGTGAADGLEAVGAAADSAAGPLDATAAAADAAAAAQDRLAASSDAAGASLDATAAAGTRAGVAGDAAAAGAGAAATGHSKLKELAVGSAVAIAYSVDQAMKWDAQMTRLNTQAGVSAKQLPELSKGVLDLAGQVGQSPGNLAESLYHVESNMASLGIKAPQALNMVKVAAQGADVGHANLVDTTNALTAAVASGIPGVQNYSQAMGVLNATVGSGDMTMQDLTEALGTGALAVVKGYGVNIKDAGAALATFGDNNIRGAKAGTDLRMAVQSLAVPMSSAKKEMASLGLTTSTLADNMQKHGLLSTLDLLQAKFKANGVTAANEGQVITELFGKKAGVGLAILMEQMGRFQSKYPDLTKSANDFGQAVNTTMQTPQQKLKNLEEGAKALSITLGNLAMPSASAMIGGLDKAMSWVQGHSFADKSLTIGLGTLIAGGVAKGVFSGVETGLSGLGKIGSLLKIPGLSNLANIGKDTSLTTAATGLGASGTALDSSAAALSSAAAELSAAAGKLGMIKPGAGEPVPSGGEPGARGEPVPAGAPGEKGKPVGAAPRVPPEDGLPSGVKKFLPDVGGIASAFNPIAAATFGALVVRGIGDSMAPRGTPAGQVNQQLQNTAANKPHGDSAVNSVLGGFFADFIGSSVGQKVGGIFNKIFTGSSTGNTQRGNAPVEYPAGIGGFAGYSPSMASQNIPGTTKYTTYQGGAGRNWQPVEGPAAYQVSPPKWTSGPDQLGAGPGARVTTAGGAAAQAKIPGPDTSALTKAKAQVQQAMDQINQAISKANKQPGKIPAPDMNALTQAKAKIQSEMDQINTALAKSTGAHPAKIPAPDLSAIQAGAGKAAAAAAQINQAVDKVLAKPVKAAAPDLSAYTAAAGAAQADGANISAGLASGILAGEGAAVAAANQVASAVIAVMAKVPQTHSPSKVTTEIGKNVGQGLADGIKSKTTTAKQAATTMSQATITSLTEGLQGGKDAMDAAIQAATGTGKASDVTTISDTITKLLGDVSDALKKKQISKAEDSALVKLLKADNTKLANLAKQRAALEQEIQDAQQVATQVISNASIMNAAQYQPALGASNGGSGGPQSAITTITGMQQQAADQAQFAQQIQQLKSMGLNSQSLSQLVQAGAQAGLPVATGLTQGGKAAVNQMNEIEAQIVGSASKLGNVGGPAMYEAGQQITSGLTLGLQKDLTAIDTAMTNMANSIVKLIKTKLKIKSPSQVMADEVGAMIPAGIGAGIRQMSHLATSEADAMLARLPGVTPFSPQRPGPLPYAGGAPVQPAGGGQGSSGPSVTMHVYGSVLTQQELADHIQGVLLQKGSNNWNAGMTYPGQAL